MSADAPTAAPAKLKPFSESNGASLLAKSGSGAKVVSPFSSSVGGTKASPFGGDFSQARDMRALSCCECVTGETSAGRLRRCGT